MADLRLMEKRQKVLADFGEFALRSDDLDEVLTEACRLVAEALGTSRAKVLEIEHERGTLFVRAGIGWDEGIIGQLRIPISEHSSETFSVELGEPVITNNLATEVRFDFPQFLKDAGIKAIANAPVLLPGGKPFGLLQVDAPEPRAFNKDDSQFLRTYTMILGPVIDRLLKVHALSATEQRFRTLFESMDEGYLLGEVLFDQEGAVTDILFLEANPAAVRLAGRDFTGERMREIDPHYDEFWYEAYARVARSGESVRAEHYAAPHGRWFDFRLSKVGPPESRRVASVFQDVTDRKLTEQALRDSEQALASDLANAERLRSLSERLVLEENFQAIYDEILSAVVDITRADAGTIQIYDPGTKSLELIASLNFSRTITDYFHRVDAGSRTACGIALRTGERAVVDFPDEVEDFGCQLLTGEGIQSAVAFPLMSRTGVPLGMLNAHWRRAKHRLNERELRFLDLLARQAADLIEQRRGQAALRESEERFRAMAEAIVDVFYVTDLDQNALAYLSPGFERIWGRPPVELDTGLVSFVDTIHPEDRSVVAASKAAQVRGEATEIEYRIVRPDGAVRWVLDRCFPIPSTPGRRAAGVVSDITERRNAEDQVRATEDRFRLLVESVHDYAIFTMDRDGIVTSWPAGATAVFGWSEAEMLGRSVDVTFTPEDLAKDVPRHERETAARDGLAPNVRWHLRNNGSRIFIDGSMQPLMDGAGEVREFIKIGQDITEVRRVQQALLESEQRLRTLAEGIPQLVWRSADGGRWTWSSPQWQVWTGQNIQESLELGWLDAIHPDDRASVVEAWQNAAATAGINVEYRVRRASDGAYLWHHTRSTPVLDSMGNVIEWLGTTTDVQQLKEFQERQEVMVAELQHRTRNLIAVVRSIALQTMAQTGPTDAFREEFNHRLEALARVQGLLSRSDEEPITIEALIRMELDALGIEPETGFVDVEGPAVPIRHSVVQTLALALHELATNARKYGALSSKQGRLDIRWQLCAGSEGQRLTLKWEEVGGQPPKASDETRRGYGRELIEQALPYSLNAKTSFEHDEAGLRCTIDMPLERKRSRRKVI